MLHTKSTVANFLKKGKNNKFGAKATEYNGRKYPSKFEAKTAADLDLRVRAGDIIKWEAQFKCEIWAYNRHGEKACMVSHKVDFRTHNNDGSFTLLEAKGVETADYKMRRKFLLSLWLPENDDHDYVVLYQDKRKNKLF